LLQYLTTEKSHEDIGLGSFMLELLSSFGTHHTYCNATMEAEGFYSGRKFVVTKDIIEVDDHPKVGCYSKLMVWDMGSPSSPSNDSVFSSPPKLMTLCTQSSIIQQV